jgi:hypothetical protein
LVIRLVLLGGCVFAVRQLLNPDSFVRLSRRYRKLSLTSSSLNASETRQLAIVWFFVSLTIFVSVGVSTYVRFRH